jgi:hypothetical protein
VIKLPPWVGLLFVFWAISSQAKNLAQLNSLVPETVKNYFFMDSLLSEQEKLVHNHQQKVQLIALVDTSPFVTSSAELILSKPRRVCSGYDNTVCQDLSAKYAQTNVPVLFYGFYKISGDAIFTFGLNTGFDSPKLSVTPSISLGGAKRWYLSSAKTSHIIFEGNYWLGGAIMHRPCLDSYDREYYCPTLTAWRDFSYASNPKSYSFKLWYQLTF